MGHIYFTKTITKTKAYHSDGSFRFRFLERICENLLTLHFYGGKENRIFSFSISFTPHFSLLTSHFSLLTPSKKRLGAQAMCLRSEEREVYETCCLFKESNDYQMLPQSPPRPLVMELIVPLLSSMPTGCVGCPSSTQLL